MPATFEMCQKCARLYASGTTCDRCASNGCRPMAVPGRPPAASAPARAAALPRNGPMRLAEEMPDDTPTVVMPSVRPPAPAAQPIGSLTFHGSGGSLLVIQIVNMLLTIITLGIYSAWAKVRVRKYLLSQTELEGDRFAYHGTGRELFNGMFQGGFVIGGLFALTEAVSYLQLGALVEGLVVALVYGVILALVPVAIIGSRRYRLSRISWRGIRFSLRAATADFFKLFMKGFVLTGLTLGIYYPIFMTKKFGFLAAHSYFGNQRFEFDGEGRELMRSYLLAGLLLIPTLGLSMIWWAAAKRRYLWSHTRIAGVRFHCAVAGGALFKLYAVNALLLLVTLGLAWPWVSVRNLRFTYENLSLNGAIDLGAIAQEAQAANSLADGLDGALELDTGLAA